MADSAAQFIEALNLLNTNVSSLTQTLDALQQSFSNRPTVNRPPPAQKQPEKSVQEQEDEYWESPQASQAVSNIIGGDLSGATVLRDLREVEKKIDDVTKAQEMGIISFRESVGMLAGLSAEYVSLKAVATGRTLGGQAGAKIARAVTKAPGAGAGFAMSQLTGIATGTMGLLGGTALAGGLFGLMLHGIKEADRLNAEAGEIVNIFSAAGTTASRGAIGHFAAFQERAQKFYGMSRQEVQGVLKTFLLAGVSIEEIMEGGRKGIGEVGHDVVTLTLGMDKMFELGGGFTAGQAMKLVQMQGLGVGDAVDRITKVEMLAHRASVSVSGFTEEAVTAANELKDYGVQVDSVAVGMTLLQGRFQDIGLNAQAAMEFAQQGVKEITSGLKGAGLSVQGLLMQQLGASGASLEGRYQMMDALQSGDERTLMEVTRGLYGVAKKETKGTYGGKDEVRQREYLERQGFGVMGAKAIYTMGVHIDRGQSIDEISKKEWGDIKKAFKVEGSKTSDLMKKSEQLSKALAALGQGVLLTITNFMALMIISVKTMLSVDWKLEIVEGVIKTTLGQSAASIVRGIAEVVGASDARVADSSQVMQMFNQQWRATTKAAGDTYSGIARTKGAIMDVARPLIKPILIAMDYRDLR